MSLPNCVTHHACECIEADRKRLREESDEAIEIIENLNRLACVAMIDANRDCHKYDITAELAEARAFLARMEVKL